MTSKRSMSNRLSLRETLHAGRPAIRGVPGMKSWGTRQIAGVLLLSAGFCRLVFC
jgi:hypothetical protein